MAGGIQPGSEAGSEESKKLDSNVKRISEAIAQYIKDNNTVDAPVREVGHVNRTAECVSDIIKKQAALPELVEIGVTVGCVPDGGMWFDGDRYKLDRKLLSVYEAKHQGDAGNAIERWAKNHTLALAINPNVVYHTFMTGGGVSENGPLRKFGNSMTRVYGDDKVKFYYKVDGFTQEEIFDVMKQSLELDFGINLDFTFDDIKSLIKKDKKDEPKKGRGRPKKISVDLGAIIVQVNPQVKQTPEQVLPESVENKTENQVEEHFITSLRDPNDPLTVAWRKVPSIEKAEAKEVILELIQEGNSNVQIATNVLELYTDNK